MAAKTLPCSPKLGEHQICKHCHKRIVWTEAGWFHTHSNKLSCRKGKDSPDAQPVQQYQID